MTKHRYPKSICLIGLALIALGITFKLNHLQGAEPVFNAGAACLVLGLMGWAVAILRH